MLTNPLKLADKKTSYPGCFVVLSYGVKNSSEPGRPTKAVVKLAHKWWKKFPKTSVIMSTGDNQGLGVTNAQVMAIYAKKLGIPEKKIIEEGRSLNTYENLLFSQKIIKKRFFTNPTIVALDLHVRRAVATAKKLGWKNFFWLSAYSKGEPSYGLKYLQTYSRLSIFVYEVFALIYSKLKGWI